MSYEKDRRIAELEAELKIRLEADVVPGEIYRDVCRQLKERDYHRNN